MILPPRQASVLAFIREQIRRRFPPTLAEIGSEFGISPEGAARHLAALQRKGLIRREAGKCRAITMVEINQPCGDISIS